MYKHLKLQKYEFELYTKTVGRLLFLTRLMTYVHIDVFLKLQ